MVGGHVFVEWCEAHGNPDHLDPIIELYKGAFEKLVAGLTDLETAASRAAKYVGGKKRRGPPSGTAALPHDFIVASETVYQDITKRKAGAGEGPFAEFVMRFLVSLERHLAMGSVVKAIKDARQYEKAHPATSQWGTVNI